VRPHGSSAEQLGRNSASGEHPQLYAEQVRLLYGNALVGLIATLINAPVLVFILRSVVPHRVLTTWLVCIVLISIARLVQLAWFRRVPPESSDVGRWGTRFIIGLALSGIIWGSAGIFLFPVESIIHQAFLAFVLGGMAIGAAGAFSVVIPAFLAYALPSLIPLIVRFLAAGDEMHLAMGGMSLLFVILITGIALHINRVTLASLLLRFEKNSLVVNLSSANNDLEKLNRELSSETVERRKAEEELTRHREHLEELVDNRSGELIAANTKLQQEISERKKAEEHIGALNEQLNHQVAELDSFVYSVSHDLRAPLRIVKGLSEMVLVDQSDRLNDKVKELLNSILRNALRMDELIVSLLDLSKAARQEMHMADIDMEELVKEVGDEIMHGSSEQTLRLEVKMLPPTRGDETLIRQVFVNLLSNAIKFARHKETAVVEVGGWTEDKEKVYFVKDNGVGFDPKYADKLFSPFQRLHTLKEFEGTGIGLSIVQRIIVRHGGRVWAEGKPNEGATFFSACQRGNLYTTSLRRWR
jgi:signal transduction histidine kinase